jgi:uroporphyrinogen III methyltransferase/synthase
MTALNPHYNGLRQPLRARTPRRGATTSRAQRAGRVYLVGAGPGDPGLITVRGRACLARAEVVLHDRLAAEELRELCRPGTEFIDVGKAPGRVALTQEQINAALVEHARAGRIVVRLKGGDPFVFGRGGEEADACRAACVPCVAVAGVSSALAAPAAAGIPVTQRGLARSFAVITGHTEDGAELPQYDYGALARLDTLVVLMGRSSLRAVTAALQAAGKPGTTPAAAIAAATTPRQQVVLGTLESISEDAAQLAPGAAVTTVIGPTAALARSAKRRLAGLTGRRIALTHALTTTSELEHLLRSAGVTCVPYPLISIRYPEPCDLDRHLARLASYRWVVFSSVHGVRGFWRRLTAAGKDARALGGVQVAAVGPGTRRELGICGVRPDLVPEVHCSAALLAALVAREPLRGARVLYPRGSQALPQLGWGLCAAGAQVDEGIVYCTEDATPSSAQREEFRRGVDAIVFSSPSAVRCFRALGGTADGAVLACIGETTANVARGLGYPVDIVPEHAGSAGLVEALRAYFTRSSDDVATR